MSNFNPTRMRTFDNGLGARYDDAMNAAQLTREVNNKDLVELQTEIKDLVNAFVGVAQQRAEQTRERLDASLTKEEIKAIRWVTNSLTPIQEQLNECLNHCGILKSDRESMGFTR